MNVWPGRISRIDPRLLDGALAVAATGITLAWAEYDLTGPLASA